MRIVNIYILCIILSHTTSCNDTQTIQYEVPLTTSTNATNNNDTKTHVESSNMLSHSDNTNTQNQQQNKNHMPAQYSNDSNTTQTHSLYELSDNELHTMINFLPISIQKKIMDRKIIFLQLINEVLQEPSEYWQLIDKKHTISPIDYIPPDLVVLDDYPFITVSRPKHVVRAVMIPDLQAMIYAATQEGITLTVSSTYRSYEYQKKLFQRYVEKDGYDAALQYSAQAGTSQHQLGLVIDFGSITAAYENTSAGKWQAKNAWRFGFSLSYPKGYKHITGYIYEPWHFRYVGKKISLLQKEYFNNIQQYTLEFLHNNKKQLLSYTQ